MKACINPKHKNNGMPLDGVLTRREVNEGHIFCLRCRAKGYDEEKWRKQNGAETKTSKNK